MADINLGVGGANSAVGGYDIDNSLKFESDNSEYLVRSQTQGNQQTWTFSTWIKRSEICKSIHTYTGSQPYQAIFGAGSASADNNTQLSFYGDGSNDDYLVMYLDNGGSRYLHGVVAKAFRDTAAWYHIVWAIDTTQSTGSDRSKVYVNGVLQTLSSETDPVLNSSTRVNDNSGNIAIGSIGYAPNLLMNGYLAETVLIDGQQLTASDFGQFDANTGIWKPKNVSGLSFGTTGFYLKYDNASSLGADSSGNGNNFTATNITSVDQATTTPTNTFTTFEDKYWYQNTQVVAEAIVRKGNTHWETTRASFWRTGFSNNAVSNGKWYAEFSPNTSTAMIGVGSIDKIDGTLDSGPNTHLGASNTGAIGFYVANGRLFENGSLTIGWGGTANANDILGIALDMDNGKVYFAINNTWQNSADPAAGTGGVSLTYPSDAYYMGVSFYGNNIFLANWGGYTDISIASGNADANDYGNFEYAPPTGYYAWCTKNLAEFG